MDWFYVTPDQGRAILTAIVAAVALTIFVILPLLLWLGNSVRRELIDSKENWTTVKTVMTAGYCYQVHKTTGKRRTYTVLTGDTSVNKDWLHGLAEEP